MNRTWYVILALVFATAVAVPGALAFPENSLVRKKCTGCHEPAGGKIPKVEEIRTTPEEWTVIIDRMHRLYGMGLTREETDILLKELCSTQMLTPEELDKVSYLNLYNNPQTVETPQGGDQEKLFATCVRCHSAGKIFSYRMTKELWAKLREFHIYQVPTVLYQMREMRWMTEAAAVLATLGQTHAYGRAWQAPAAKPAGSYLLLGYEPGKGNYRGQAQIRATGGDDYSVTGTLVYEDGISENFKGEATLYGGIAFRTRFTHNGVKTLGAYTFADGQLKGEHHFPAPDFRTSSSTWYPANGKAAILKVTPGYLLAGETTTLTLEGVKLPEVAAKDVSFSDGSVEVVSARRIAPEVIEVTAVYKGEGIRKVAVSAGGLDKVPVTLATRIDYIRITPELGRARISGGKHFPAEGLQFEALAFAGEVALGPVPALFRLTAQNKRANDDDLAWLGNISRTGKYVPVGDYAPIASREFHGEGSGMVNVEAEYKRGDRAFLAKARLAVTLPDFVPRIR
jgi:quinohemoprotein amine dehydrogenase